MTTGYVWHELYGWHDTGTSAGLLRPDPLAGIQPGEPMEHPEAKRRLHQLVVVSGLIDHLTPLVPSPVTDEQILRVHHPGHLAALTAGSADLRGGDAGDGESPFGYHGLHIARLAAGGTVEATVAVVEGRVDNAYALVRPPGHHALPDRGMGFCPLANIAIAVRHVQAVLGVGRVAVVDWDVHHGNGTQEVFADDPDVLAISIHQDDLYPPRSGLLQDRGRPGGAGTTLNLPLPPGSGEGAYRELTDRVLVPALRRFAPELIMVACGFDGSAYDPLGRQLLTSRGFAALTRAVLDVADELGHGRVVLSHEGGYSPSYVPFCGLAVLEELAGVRTGVDDPIAPRLVGIGGQQLQDHQARLIDEAASMVDSLPRPPSRSGSDVMSRSSDGS